jgi:Tol biopolymer transport system component
VYWLDITDSRRRTQRTIHIAGASDLAFAPDSRRLAMIGSGGSGYGLYLADLETDELRLLAPVEWARSLAWSPAGDQLALIGKLPGGAGPEELVVIDSQSGQVTYQARIENTHLLPADAPLLGWGADFLQQFPTKNGGLEACVEP